MPSSYRSMGKVDLFSALQQSSNVYFSYLASDILESPNDLKNAALEFGYGRRTGIDLPGELRGKVPNDLLDNRTGLYSFAIGQHSFITTPLQTSLMYTAIANKGDVLKPQILNLSCGLDPSRHIFDHTKKYPYKKALNSVGITFPIFTNAWKGNITSHVSPQIKEKKNSLFMPDDIRHTLLEAMNRVIWDEKGSAYPYKIRALYENRSYMKDYLSLRNQVVGKTASAEFMYRPHIDRETPAIICKDTWFGGISFSDEHTKTWEEPELAIVVYLRYGDYGKETAPLAMQMIKKWRDIIKKESAKSYTETYSNRSLNTPEESTP